MTLCAFVEIDVILRFGDIYESLVSVFSCVYLVDALARLFFRPHNSVSMIFSHGPWVTHGTWVVPRRPAAGRPAVDSKYLENCPSFPSPVAIRFHQNDVSTFESICRGILPLWNLDFRISSRPLFKQPFIGYYILDNEDEFAPHLFE